ncbi:hypothetical protein DRB07_07930 [Actinomyces sp. Z3]|nr:hypothetical protein DRB07_07930 [Actinomyces sp. Z3]
MRGQAGGAGSITWATGKGQHTTAARENARNGTTTKTIDSPGGSRSRPVVPRDRAGSFTPRLVRKDRAAHGAAWTR